MICSSIEDADCGESESGVIVAFDVCRVIPKVANSRESLLGSSFAPKRSIYNVPTRSGWRVDPSSKAKHDLSLI